MLLVESRARLPDFLVIGAPKCGTTAISAFLRSHPAIYLSSCKEPHYFSYVCEKQPSWACTTQTEYARLFADAAAENRCGEASTWYLYSESAARTIREQIPNCRLIAILRDPVERAFSSWAFRVQSSWERLADFEAALEAEPARIREGWSWDYHYLSVGFYYEQLRRYYELFDSNQIHVCLFEDLQSNPKRVMKEIYEFLGVDATFAPNTSERYNVTSFPRSLALNQLLHRSGRLHEFSRTLVPNRLRSAIVERITQLNSTSKPELSMRIRRELTDRYRNDIMNVQRLTGLDCSAWMTRGTPLSV